MTQACDRVRKLFSPFREGDLAAGPMREMQQHLDSCPSCHERYQRFGDALHDLRNMPRHPVPRQFAAEILEQIHEGSEESQASQQSQGDGVVVSNRAEVTPLHAWRWNAARWAAGIVVGITLVLVWLTWERNVSAPDALTHADWKRLETRLTQLQDGLEQSVEERDALVARQERSHLEDLKNLREQWSLFEKGSQEERRLMRESLAQLSDDLGERLEALSSREDPLDRERVTEEIMAALDQRLNRVDARFDKWQRELSEEMTSWRGRLGELEKATTELVRAGRSPNGEYLASRRTPERFVSEVVTTDQPPRRYAAIRFYLRTNGAVIWDADTEHPSYIANLFEIYENESGAVKESALAELDDLFAKPLASQGGESSDFLSALLLSSDDETEASSGSQRVEMYREYWTKELRGRAE